MAVVIPILRTSARLRDRDPILDLDLRNIEVGAKFEGHVNLETAISGRVRGHVDHVLDAVDLLLEGSNHRGGNHVCARPGILTAHPHDRRRDLRIRGDRQPPN